MSVSVSLHPGKQLRPSSLLRRIHKPALASNRGADMTNTAALGAEPAEAPAPRMRRYLPLAIVTTAIVIVLPATLSAALIPRGGVLLTLISAALAVALSLALAALGATLWKRRRRSRDLVFAELMLWGWARRCWTERRLSQARDLFESARRAGPDINIEVLLGLSRLLEARDAYVHGHGHRVARHSVRMARAMGLSEMEVAKIRTAAEVHDVGKIQTPRAILNNPEKLSDAEFAEIKRHPVQGAEMLTAVGDAEITAMVRHHHERIDGRGYPDGLAGEAIPLGARIIAVADTFDAITSNRAYRSAGSQKRALDILTREAGVQLDAQAVAMFKQGYSARRSIAASALSTAAAGRALAVLQSATSNFGLGFGSIGALLPALGAAGVLAASPSVLHLTHNAGASRGGGASPQAVLHLSAKASSAATVSSQRGRALHARLGHRDGSRSGASGESSLTAPGATTTTATTLAVSQSTGSDTSAGVSTGTGTGVHAGGRTTQSVSSGTAAGGDAPVAAQPGQTVTTSPSGPTPSKSSSPTKAASAGTTTTPAPTASTPSVSTPAISTPSVTTPPVTTPSVKAPGVTVPSVTVPSVTVPSVTVPSVTLPKTP
jgi:hypothetical protein